MSASSSSRNFSHGFPTPGPQRPSGQQVMDHTFFASRTEWKRIREELDFDYIVVGSGFCGYAFAERMFAGNPNSRILLLERGPFFLPEHFQNLPMPYLRTMGDTSETFPWTLSMRTRNAPWIRWQHGMVPFFGGRSTLWSAWCPRPTPEEMRGWPKPVIAAAQAYFRDAEKLLNVVPANRIDGDEVALLPKNRPIFRVLQDGLFALLEKNLDKIPSATRVIPAPLAVGAPELQGVDFSKYSTPGPLLQLADRQQGLAGRGKGEPLRIVADCVVKRIIQQENRATALDTSRGVLSVGDAKVILSMGAMPPTTLLLNSFDVRNVGRRFTSHFVSSIVARVRREDYSFAAELGDLELAAIYLAGIDPQNGMQYHVQLTGLSDRHPIKNAATAARNMPDVLATASMEQLLQSEDYVVFVCAVLGEMNARNPDTWVRRNDGDDPTTNVTLQVAADKSDLSVWDVMDEATFQALERALSPKGREAVEYWHGTPDSGKFRKERPGNEQIRVDALVHDGSTLWIGEDDESPRSPVALDYRPRGVENVYVTGGGLWPTSGSWNPTLTMVALAQHLADRLAEQEKG